MKVQIIPHPEELAELSQEQVEAFKRRMAESKPAAQGTKVLNIHDDTYDTVEISKQF